MNELSDENDVEAKEFQQMILGLLKFYDVSDIAERYSCSITTVRRWCDGTTVACRDRTRIAIEVWLELRQGLHGLVRPRSVIDGLGVIPGRRTDDTHDLLGETPRIDRGIRLLVAGQREGILRSATDAELASQHLRSLTHVEPADRIDQRLL